MKRATIVVIILLLGAHWCLGTNNEAPIVVDATVIRVEPWGITKTSCGTVLNYRMAEYRVDTVYRGSGKSGEQIVVRHLACNYNELEGLKAGAKVMLVTKPLSHPEDALWSATSVVQGEREHVVVRYEALKVATIVYSMTDEP